MNTLSTSNANINLDDIDWTMTIEAQCGLFDLRMREPGRTQYNFIVVNLA